MGRKKTDEPSTSSRKLRPRTENEESTMLEEQPDKIVKVVAEKKGKKQIKKQSKAAVSKPKRPGRHQYRSTMQSIVLLTDNMPIRDEHLTALRATPFWHFFNAILNKKYDDINDFRKEEGAIMKIIQAYEDKRDGFNIGGKTVKITAEEISLIFGISDGSTPISTSWGKKPESDFVKRMFPKDNDLSKKVLEIAVWKAVKSKNENAYDDFARTLCLYAFVSLFFSSSGTTISWAYIKYVEDLEEMKEYEWATAIASHLMSKVRLKHGSPTKVTGCVPALLYWLCEHTTLVKPRKEKAYPRYLKWNLNKINRAMDEVDLKTLCAEKVIKGKLEAKLRVEHAILGLHKIANEEEAEIEQSEEESEGDENESDNKKTEGDENKEESVEKNDEEMETENNSEKGSGGEDGLASSKPMSVTGYQIPQKLSPRGRAIVQIEIASLKKQCENLKESMGAIEQENTILKTKLEEQQGIKVTEEGGNRGDEEFDKRIEELTAQHNKEMKEIEERLNTRMVMFQAMEREKKELLQKVDNLTIENEELKAQLKAKKAEEEEDKEEELQELRNQKQGISTDQAMQELSDRMLEQELVDASEKIKQLTKDNEELTERVLKAEKTDEQEENKRLRKKKRHADYKWETQSEKKKEKELKKQGKT